MSTSSGTPETWIASFCSLLGHEYFAEVSEEFIEDDFNLTGLQSQVQLYKEALEVCFQSNGWSERFEGHAACFSTYGTGANRRARLTTFSFPL